MLIDGEKYKVRPKPSQQDVRKLRWTGGFFGGTFKLCHNPVPCVNGADCTFAHNKGELMVWNGEFNPLGLFLGVIVQRNTVIIALDEIHITRAPCSLSI